MPTKIEAHGDVRLRELPSGGRSRLCELHRQMPGRITLKPPTRNSLSAGEALAKRWAFLSLDQMPQLGSTGP